jgi:cytochrome P450
VPGPPAADFRVTDIDGTPDPYAVLAELRSVGPVAAVDGGYVAVTGHGAALEALRHPGCGSSPIAALYLGALPPGAARDEMSHRINFLDPPDHPRVRGIVSKAFTPRRVAALRPWMEASAEGLLDGLEGRDEVDLLADFGHQLPSLVISEMLGVPPADRDRLTAFSDAVAPLLGTSVSPEDKAAAVAAAEEFHGYLSALLDDRASAPGEDLLSALLEAEEDGERLHRVELLSLAATLYSAGHRTTRDLFSNGMTVLLGDPSRYGAVVGGAWPVEQVVDEFLRFETPTLYVARVPSEPVVIGGLEVPAMTPLLVYLAAANRDPAAYDRPDEFRPGRDGPAPLSFAFGAHYCLGASLARNEAEVMLAAVSRRWPHLQLAGGSADLSWHQRGPFRGVDRLPVLPGRPGQISE